MRVSRVASFAGSVTILLRAASTPLKMLFWTGFLLLGSLLLLTAAPMQAQESGPAVTQPPVAVYDIVCAYNRETFTLRGLSIRTDSDQAIQANIPSVATVRMGAVNGLNYLFPTGTCGELIAYFDPYAMRPPTGKDAPRLQSLPSESLDGVPCRVLQQTDPTLPPRPFGPPVPTLPRVTLRWYVAPDGQIKRIRGEFQLWKADGKTPDTALLVMTADYRYRDPIGSPSRPLSPPPLRTLAVPLPKAEAIRDIACSPSAPFLVTASNGGTLTVWDINSLKPVYALQGHSGWGRSLAFSGDGSLLADGTQGQDSVAHVWDMRTGQKVRDIDTKSLGLTSLALSTDGRLLATCGFSPGVTEPVRVWDTTSGHLLASVDAASADQIAFSPDGKTLATASSHSIHLWDTATWKERRRLEPEVSLSGSFGYAPLTFSPDSRLLAVGDTRSNGFRIGLLADNTVEPSADTAVRVWDAQTGSLVQILSGTTGPVNALAFAPNGKWLAVVDADCGTEGAGRNSALLLWDTRTWQQTGIAASEHGKSIVSVAWTADSSTLLTSYSDALVKFWPAPNK